MLTEALAGSLHCVLLWSSHLVYNNWRSSKTRGLCGCSANTPQRQSCLAYSASAFVGHGLKILLEFYTCTTHTGSLGFASVLLCAFQYKFDRARNGLSCGIHDPLMPSFYWSVCKITKAICLFLHDLLHFASLYLSHGRNRILFQSKYVFAYAEKTTRVLGIMKDGWYNLCAER